MFLSINDIAFSDITWSREIRKGRLSNGTIALAPVSLPVKQRGFRWTTITSSWIWRHKKLRISLIIKCSRLWRNWRRRLSSSRAPWRLRYTVSIVLAPRMF